jgi:hypothetical protein
VTNPEIRISASLIAEAVGGVTMAYLFTGQITSHAATVKIDRVAYLYKLETAGKETSLLDTARLNRVPISSLVFNSSLIRWITSSGSVTFGLAIFPTLFWVCNGMIEQARPIEYFFSEWFSLKCQIYRWNMLNEKRHRKSLGFE